MLASVAYMFLKQSHCRKARRQILGVMSRRLPLPLVRKRNRSTVDLVSESLFGPRATNRCLQVRELPLHSKSVMRWQVLAGGEDGNLEPPRRARFAGTWHVAGPQSHGGGGSLLLVH